MIKINGEGESIWTKALSNFRPNSAIEATDGGFVFTGSMILNDKKDTDVYQTKVDENI